MFRALTRWIREGRCARENFPENGGGLRAVWSLGSCGGEGGRRAASSRFCDNCWLLRPGEVLQNGHMGLEAWIVMALWIPRPVFCLSSKRTGQGSQRVILDLLIRLLILEYHKCLHKCWRSHFTYSVSRFR